MKFTNKDKKRKFIQGEKWRKKAVLRAVLRYNARGLTSHLPYFIKVKLLLLLLLFLKKLHLQVTTYNSIIRNCRRLPRSFILSWSFNKPLPFD